MTELLIYSFCAYGLAYIVGESKISLPLRMWIEPPSVRDAKVSWLIQCFDSIRLVVLSLIECPACFGTWVGFFYGLWSAPTFMPPETRGAVLLGLYTCGSNHFLSQLGGKGG